MNDRLIKLYEEYWPILSTQMHNILSNSDLSQKPTNPLLLRINEEEYLGADIKVMFLGQETNDWGKLFTGNIQDTLEIYDDFYNSGDAFSDYGGHFWNGVNRFKYLLEKQHPTKSFAYVWNNVVKIGAAGRNQNHPMNHIYDVEKKSFKVLDKEIEILDPDIILFISGPYYDHNIASILEDVRFVSLDSNFNLRQIAKLTYKERKNIFRTYHPNYLWRNNINEYFEEIIKSLEL